MKCYMVCEGDHTVCNCLRMKEKITLEDMEKESCNGSGNSVLPEHDSARGSGRVGSD